jgi:hypothetical protein
LVVCHFETSVGWQLSGLSGLDFSLVTLQIPFMREESVDKAPTEVCAPLDPWGVDETDGKKRPAGSRALCFN